MSINRNGCFNQIGASLPTMDGTNRGIPSWGYAVVYGGKVEEFTSFVTPDAFADSMSALRGLITTLTVSDVELYVRQGSAWRGVFGVGDTDILHVFVLPKVGGSSVDKAASPYGIHNRSSVQVDQALQEIGMAVIKTYQFWQSEYRKATKKNAEAIETGLFASKMLVVDEIMSGSRCPELLRNVFEARVRNDYSPSEVKDLVHISASTFNRCWADLKRFVGQEVIRYFNGDLEQIERLIRDYQFT